MVSTFLYPALSPKYQLETLVFCISSTSLSTLPSVSSILSQNIIPLTPRLILAGVAIIYLILHLLTNFMTVKCGFKGFESGEYGNPPLFSYWLRQTTIYVLSLTTMKLLVVSLFAIWPGIFKVGEWLLSFLGTSDVLQVIL